MKEQVKGNITELATKSLGRLIWDYSLPAVVGMVVMSMLNVIDRIFIGRGVGAEAIAGLAITFPVMNISAAIGVLVGAGAAARVSIMLGRNDLPGAQHVLGNSLTLIVMNAVIYISLLAFYLDDLLRLFGASDATLPYAHEFMVYILPGMAVMNVMYSFNNLMRASGYPTRAMVTMFIVAGINVVLAPVFIFGLKLGIRGAAIATDIAAFIGMIFVLAHFFQPSVTLRFTRDTFRLRRRIVWAIVSIGAAPSIVNFTSSAINAIINRSLYTYGGDMAVGAVGIFTTYTSLLCMIVVGICQGVQPILGYNYGAGLHSRLRRAFGISVAAGLTITTLGYIGSRTIPSLIAGAFTTDPQLIAVTDNALRISMTLFWPVGFQIVATTFFQSIGMAGKAIFLSLIRQIIFLIPLLYILPHYFGLNGVWASFPSSDAAATVVTLIMVWWQLRRLSRHPLEPIHR